MMLSTAKREPRSRAAVRPEREEELRPPVVLLAAGQGSRMKAGGIETPKQAIKMLGLTMAERSIATFMEAGIDHFIVVLGHDAQRVRSEYEAAARRRGCTIQFVRARDWHLGNGASALAAKDAVGTGSFLLAMSDHLFSPDLVRKALESAPGYREVCLAVDRRLDSVSDFEDLTKVSTLGDRIVDLGKDIDEWDAGDTGLFYCTEVLFDGLAAARAEGEHSLSAGVRRCMRLGRVRAIDVTGSMWFDLDTPEAIEQAQKALLATLDKKSEDGFIARILNRPISRRMTRFLVHLPVTPDQITLLSFGLALLGAGLLAAPSAYPLWILGGLIIQFASILDGCDGEIARLKLAGSKRGACLDTLLDRYADMAVALAITRAAVAATGHSWLWIPGMLAAGGFILASYSKKEYRIRFGSEFPVTVLARLNKRDSRVFILALGALLGRPLEALFLAGAIAHAGVLHVLLLPWTGGAEARPYAVPRVSEEERTLLGHLRAAEGVSSSPVPPGAAAMEGSIPMTRTTRRR